jgi:hypothetical protein
MVPQSTFRVWVKRGRKSMVRALRTPRSHQRLRTVAEEWCLHFFPQALQGQSANERDVLGVSKAAAGSQKCLVRERIRGGGAGPPCHFIPKAQQQRAMVRFGLGLPSGEGWNGGSVTLKTTLPLRFPSFLLSSFPPTLKACLPLHQPQVILLNHLSRSFKTLPHGRLLPDPSSFILLPITVVV